MTEHPVWNVVAGVPVAALLAFVATALWAQAQVPAADIAVIAHRCNGHAYVENGQKACVRVAATGTRFFDIDVRFTRTGVPVALHDADLGVFGAPSVLIRNVSHTQASQHLSDSLETISTVAQMRDVVLATDGQISVELKTVPTSAQWVKLDSYLIPIRDRVVLHSRNPVTVATAHARGYPQVGWDVVDDVAPDELPVGTDVVLAEASKVDRTSTQALVSAGVDVWCYQCNDPVSWAAMQAAGVSGFDTDDHQGARAWVEAHS